MTEPMTDEQLPTEYARVKSILGKAKDAALKAEGYTWNSFGELELAVEQYMADKETVQTEFGVLQAIRKPIFLNKGKPQGYQTIYIKLSPGKEA